MTAREAIPFTAAISLETYTGMDAVARDRFGASLETLSSADPYFVYRLLRDAVIGGISDPNDGAASKDVNYSDGTSISSTKNGPEAATAAMRNMLEAALPTLVVEPIQVVLSVFREQQDSLEPVLSFRVNPTDPTF